MKEPWVTSQNSDQQKEQNVFSKMSRGVVRTEPSCLGSDMGEYRPAWPGRAADELWGLLGSRAEAGPMQPGSQPQGGVLGTGFGEPTWQCSCAAPRSVPPAVPTPALLEELSSWQMTSHPAPPAHTSSARCQSPCLRRGCSVSFVLLWDFLVLVFTFWLFPTTRLFQMCSKLSSVAREQV